MAGGVPRLNVMPQPQHRTKEEEKRIHQVKRNIEEKYKKITTKKGSKEKNNEK